jgi:hypothetical protein
MRGENGALRPAHRHSARLAEGEGGGEGGGLSVRVVRVVFVSCNRRAARGREEGKMIAWGWMDLGG